MNKLEKIFEGVSTYTCVEGVGEKKNGSVIVLQFAEKGYGFGNIAIQQDKSGQIFVDSERTNKDHVAVIISRLLDNAIFDWETDPKKHAAWNKAMSVYCCNCGCGWDKSKPKRKK